MIALGAGTAAAVHAVAEYGGIATGAWLYRRALRAQAQAEDALRKASFHRSHRQHASGAPPSPCKG